MTELPISSPYRSKPEAPVTETDRDQLSSRLNQAFSQGTLDAAEYQARLDRLFAADKLGELVPVVDGLPALQTYSDPANITSGGTPGSLREARASSAMTLAVIGALVAVVVLVAILLVLL